MIHESVTFKGKEIYLHNSREDAFIYLEHLRGSGVTNMLGAAPYFQTDMNCTKEEASYWLVEWIESFQTGD